MLAVFAAVLALAGAPASTQVSCYTQLPGDKDGLALLDDRGVPFAIQLADGVACLAARYVAADRPGRDLIAAQHRYVVPAAFVGVGLLVALHEAEHVGLRSTDECLVERTALLKLPGLLKRYMPRQWRQALEFARYYDSQLPAKYHGC